MAATLPTNANGEVPALRSRFSRTYRRNNQLQTVMSTAPMNYRSATGTWVPIDTTLHAQQDGSVVNGADSMSVALPAAADGAFTVRQGTGSVSFSLVGAAAAAVTVTGSQATYVDVLPGVDAVYDTRAETVEQTLRLKSASAPTSFSSLVTVPSGASIRADADGSLSLLSADGSVQGSLPAPVMRDSSHDLDHDTSSAVTYTVSGVSPRYTVTVTPDHRWLRDPRRVFPVMLDPTVTFGTANDLGCYVTNPGTGTPPPDPVLCAANTGTDNPLAYGSTAYVRRAFLQFGDLTAAGSPLPSDAVISNADLTLTEYTASGPAGLVTNVQRPAASWNSSITWATQPITSGTEFDHTIVYPPGVGGSVTLNPTLLISSIVKGGVPNYGLEIRLYNESVSNTIQFYGFANATHSPTLTITWSPAVGQQTFVGAYDHKLSDRADIHVDYGDRNLVVNGTDETMTGPGQSLTVRRTYNSLTAANGISGAYGLGWSLNGGVDTGITAINRAAVAIRRPGGAVGVFFRNFSISSPATIGAYTSAPGWKADLTMPDSTHYKLVFRSSPHVTWTYTLAVSTDTTAPLTSSADGNSNTITYTNSGGVTTAVGDTTGSRSVGLTYTSGAVTGMSESLVSGATGARSWSYTYSSANLSTYVDPAGETTRYCYTSNLLTKIITPVGSDSGATCATTQGTDVTDIAYDSTGHVTSISYENGTSSALSVQFSTTQVLTASAPGITQFTDGLSKNTQYYYDGSDRITKTITPNGNTATATYNATNDVTASVSPNNFGTGTGAGGADPTTTATYTGDNLTHLVTATQASGASTSVTWNASFGGTETNQPDYVSDDRQAASTSPVSSGSYATHLQYSTAGGGQLDSSTKGSATATVRRQGETGVANCGPAGAAAYAGAVCETRDADYSSSFTARHRVLYSYDSLGELTSLTPAQPDNSRTTPPAVTYTYDGQSRLKTVTDSRGKSTTYTYDTLDHTTRITYNDNTYTAYTYDDDGDQLTAIDYNASGVKFSGRGETYAYDKLNRLITETQDGKAASRYTWDANSRLLTFDDGSGTAGTYGYDNDGKLTSFTEPGGSCTGYQLAAPVSLPPSTAKCVLFAVDKNGNRLRTVYPGGGEQDQTYNTPETLTELLGKGTSGGTAATLLDYKFYYDSASVHTAHIFDRTETVSNTRLSYAYGTEGRLTSAVQYNSATLGAGTATASWLYCYDANGNRTSTSTAVGASCPGGTAYTYDGANQQLGSGTSYDLAGNETLMPTGLPAASTSRASTYTDAGQLNTTALNGGTALDQSYYGPDNTGVVSSDTSNTSKDTLRIGSIGLYQIRHVVSNTETGRIYIERDPSGGIIALRDNTTGNHYYPLTDNLGSIIKLLDNNGAVVNAYSYDPTGTQTIVTNGYPQPLGYTGAYTNPTTGLIQLGARYLDPTLERFTQPDPESHPGDVNQANPYAYAADNPINNTDPTGAGCDSFWGCVSTPFIYAAGAGAVLGAAGGAIGCTIAGGPFDPPGCVAAGGTGAAIGGYVGWWGGLGYGIGVDIWGS